MHLHGHTAVGLTMPGVLHYLQSEWGKHERDRAHWDADKAALKVPTSHHITHITHITSPPGAHCLPGGGAHGPGAAEAGSAAPREDAGVRPAVRAACDHHITSHHITSHHRTAPSTVGALRPCRRPPPRSTSCPRVHHTTPRNQSSHHTPHTANLKRVKEGRDVLVQCVHTHDMLHGNNSA